MPIDNVTALSDDETQPAPASDGAAATTSPAPAGKSPIEPAPKGEGGKAKAKAKAKAKGKAKSSPNTKKSPKAKPKPKENPKSKAKSQAMKRPAASAELDEDEMETSCKRPATSLKVNKYIYHRDGVWGVKVNGRELMRVLGVKKCQKQFLNSKSAFDFCYICAGFDSDPQVKPAEGVSDEKLQEIAASRLSRQTAVFIFRSEV